MNSFEIVGKIVVIEAEEQVTEKFRKRDFVIVTEDQYPQHIKCQFINDGCNNLNAFKVGQIVKVKFSLAGRESKGKYFTNINAYGIYLMHDGGNLKSFPNEDNRPQAEMEAMPEVTADDLPF